MRLTVVASAALAIAACSRHPALDEDTLMAETPPATSIAAPEQQAPSFYCSAQEARAEHFWHEYKRSPLPPQAQVARNSTDQVMRLALLQASRPS